MQRTIWEDTDMTIPTTIGLPQIILFLVAICGVALLISAALGLRGGQMEKIFNDEGRHFYRKRRRHFHWKRGSSGILMML